MKTWLLIFAVASVTQLYSQSPRMSLYEEFTGETCPPCAATNPGLNAILLSATNATKVIPIKWQVPIPSAPSNTWSLYQTNSTEINWRYRGINAGGYGYVSQYTPGSAASSGINSAPQGVLDGQHQWAFGAASDHPADINNAVIATAQSYTSAFSIDMRHEWNNALTAVIVTVNITATANFNAVGPLVFRCVMVERLIQFSVQPGSNGEKTFEDVAIKSFPDIQNGTALPANWTTGQNQSFVLSCTPPSYTRRLDQISMVGFIQDDGDRKVAQASRSRALFDAKMVSAQLSPVCNSSFSPTVQIKNLGLESITSLSIVPEVDGITGAATSWNGLLSSNSSTNIVLNAITTPVGDGNHTINLNITAMNGTDFNPANNSVTQQFPVYVSGYNGSGVYEDFSAPSFPPPGWTNVNYDQGITFSRSIEAGSYWQSPLAALKYNFYDNENIGDTDELYLRAQDLRGGDNIDLSFDYAYAQKNATNNDKLEVFVSSDCGQTWTSVFSKSGAALSTCSTYTAGGPYIPDETEFSQWTTFVTALPGMNQNSVFVKFVVTNDNGNNLYIDNINVVQHLPNGVSQIHPASIETTLIPNPAKEKTQLNFYSESAQTAQLIIVSLDGRQIYKHAITTVSGQNTYAIDLAKMAPGYYLVNLELNGQTHQKKLIVSP